MVGGEELCGIDRRIPRNFRTDPVPDFMVDPGTQAAAVRVSHKLLT